MPLKNNSGYQNQPQHFHQNGSHSIKPTSRKNRNSNMPLIGNASSLGLNNYGRPPKGGQKPRLNSLSTGNLNMQGRTRQSSGFAVNTLGNNSNSRVNMPNNVKSAYGDANMSAHDDQSQAQRQFSSSTTILDANGMNPNMSTNSVVHNPMSSNYQAPFMEEQTGQVQPQALKADFPEADSYLNFAQSPGLQGPQSNPPEITISGPQATPPMSTISDTQSIVTNDAEDTNDSKDTTRGNKKDKKKKFGLFGKKKKSKK